MSNALQQSSDIVNAIPAWCADFTAIRFRLCTDRQNPVRTSLGGFVQACLKDTVTPDGEDWKKAVREGRAKKKNVLPDWSLCNDTGTNEGTPNGLIQLDFDHVDRPQELRDALRGFPGILMAAVSASGHGVFALAYAPDRDLGLYAARKYAEILSARGFKFGYDNSCEKACQLRFETYDPGLWVAPQLVALGPDYTASLLRSDARRAFWIWRNGEAGPGDYESAVTAIFTASMCAHVASDYGLHKAFVGGCDVQIVGRSGACKTQGRLKELCRIADRYPGSVRLVGGLRTTDAAFYDTFIDAAYTIQTDEKGKVVSLSPRAIPDKLAAILDESGDAETSARGNSQKSQANVIRRMACFDGEITAGQTAEMRKRFGGKLPDRIPARLVMYRTCTPDQLATKDFARQQTGGNARRVLYAKVQTDTADAAPRLCSEKKDAKAHRFLTEDSRERLDALCDWMVAKYSEIDPSQFRFSWDDPAAVTARQAAEFALERAGVDVDAVADTMIYNTALFLAVLRNAVAQDDSDRTIGANEIETAAAIALNSFAVVRELSAAGAGEQLAGCRTDSERQAFILRYLEGRPGHAIARGNMIRKHGREVISVCEDMLKNGVIREVYKACADGKNKNVYWEVTPDGEQERASQEWKMRNERKAAGSVRKSGGSVFDATAGKSLFDRLDAYRDHVGMDAKVAEKGGNDNALKSLAGKLKANADFMADEETTRMWFYGEVTSGRYDQPGRKPYTEKDADRLWRDSRKA